MRLITGMLVLCFLPLGSPGQPAEAVRKDLHGDPLPPAATVRLGTYRLWHGATVGSVAVSPDGKIVASGSRNKTRLLGPNHTLSSGGGDIRLWEAATGKLIRTLTSTASWDTHSLAFSPDGKFLAAGSSYKLSVLNVTTGELARKLEKDIGNFGAVGFSSDGKLLHATKLSSPGLGVEACRWDVVTGKQLKTWTDTIADKTNAPIGKLVQVSMRISPDGQTLLKGFSKAPGPDTDELRIFDAESGKQLGAFSGLSADTRTPVFSADGKRFAVAQGQFTYTGLSTGAGELVKLAIRADAVALAPAGAVLYCVQSNQISMWDTATGKQIQKSIPIGQNRFPWMQTPISTSGKVLAVGDGETVRLWNTGTGAEILPRLGHNAPVQHVSFTRDGQSLLSSDGQNVWRWVLATGKGDRLTQQEIAAKPGGAKGRVSSDGRIWIQPGAGGPNQNHGLFDSASGKKLGSVNVTDWWGKPDANAATGLVAWMQQDGLIRVANLKGEAVRTFGHSGPTDTRWIWSHVLCFSPDGRFLLTSFAYGQRGQAELRHAMSVWDVSSGREFRRLPIARPDGSPAHLACAAFSSDGRSLAVGQYVENLLGRKGEPVVSIWDVLAGQECRKLGSHEGAVLSIAFAPDDRSVASGSDDGTVLCWKMANDAKDQAAEINADRLQALWTDLAGDAPRAYDAVWSLSARPKEVMPLLQANLRPVPAAPQEPIEKLIDELGRENFVVRDRAMRALERLGDKAIPSLIKTLAKKPSPELRRRAEALLEQAESQQREPSNEVIRSLRALAVLERTRTPEAVSLLRSLADGADQAWLTKEARAALTRLERRPD